MDRHVTMRGVNRHVSRLVPLGTLLRKGLDRQGASPVPRGCPLLVVADPHPPTNSRIRGRSKLVLILPVLFVPSHLPLLLLLLLLLLRSGLPANPNRALLLLLLAEASLSPVPRQFLLESSPPVPRQLLLAEQQPAPRPSQKPGMLRYLIPTHLKPSGSRGS